MQKSSTFIFYRKGNRIGIYLSISIKLVLIPRQNERHSNEKCVGRLFTQSWWSSFTLILKLDSCSASSLFLRKLWGLSGRGRGSGSKETIKRFWIMEGDTRANFPKIPIRIRASLHRQGGDRTQGVLNIMLTSFPRRLSPRCWWSWHRTCSRTSRYLPHRACLPAGASRAPEDGQDGELWKPYCCCYQSIMVICTTITE